MKFKPAWPGMLRFFFDKRTPLAPKVVAVLALLYLIWPIDLFPDFIPLFGWLDDLGFIGFAMMFLSHATREYLERESKERSIVEHE